MKQYHNLFRVLIAITLPLLLGACKDKSSTSPPAYSDVNTPVTASTINTFTYTIHASQFSQSISQSLTFTSDSLVITLTTSDYTGGQAQIQVLDSLNATIFADTVSSNKVVALTHLKATMPKSCLVNLTNLSARLTFVLVGET